MMIVERRIMRGGVRNENVNMKYVRVDVLEKMKRKKKKVKRGIGGGVGCGMVGIGEGVIFGVR
ncbi:hypothetical protein, partial [Bacillus sp. WP8]|uniref:hypothetical protein n=1 Tax=Bacillus sp. WP8 TaxID=756828 RepID=UPI0011AAC925